MRRSAPLQRTTPLRRSPMPRGTSPAPRRAAPARDWSDARAKVAAARGCRVCGTGGRLEAAHTIGREHDRPRTPGGRLWVDPVDVVELCDGCHRAYDGRRLDLMPFLTLVEMAAAVAHVGIVAAVRRLSGGAAEVASRQVAA